MCVGGETFPVHFKAPRGAVRYGTVTFSPPQAEIQCSLSLPKGRYGKTFSSVYRGMGKGREGGRVVHCRDGSWELLFLGGTVKVGKYVGKQVGNQVERHRNRVVAFITTVFALLVPRGTQESRVTPTTEGCNLYTQQRAK